LAGTCKKIKAVMGNIPLILVGGMKYPATMEKILKDNNADFISLSRALIREPNLPKEMKSIRYSPVKCSYCNKCLAMISQGKSLKCYNNY